MDTGSEPLLCFNFRSHAKSVGRSWLGAHPSALLSVYTTETLLTAQPLTMPSPDPETLLTAFSAPQPHQHPLLTRPVLDAARLSLLPPSLSVARKLIQPQDPAPWATYRAETLPEAVRSPHMAYAA